MYKRPLLSRILAGFMFVVGLCLMSISFCAYVMFAFGFYGWLEYRDERIAGLIMVLLGLAFGWTMMELAIEQWKQLKGPPHRR